MEFIYGGKRIRKIGVFGLGKSNVGIISYLRRKYPKIPFILRSDNLVKTEDAMRVTKFDKILTESLALSQIEEDILFLSPSAKRERFDHTKLILSSDAELFFKNTKRALLCVSGSDGKSTTATLTSLMMTYSGVKCSCIGNVGEAMTPHTDEHFPAVVELSSFQLKHLDADFDRAVITNVTPNHLDWHGTFDDYINAKAKLILRARNPILNLEDTASATFKKSIDSYAVFSTKSDEKKIRSDAKAELYCYLKDGFICVNGDKILDTGCIISKNSYNLSNFMAAILLSYGYATRRGIYLCATRFDTLKHRCETVGNFGGVTYIDSSIDSTPQRCATTLNSLGRRCSVIIGGRSKGLDYSILIPHLIKFASTVILMGECAENIFDMLMKSKEYTDAKIPTKLVPSFDDAVVFAIENASAGDTVLLSPASTSYDSFKNFEERGQRFKEIIKEHYRGF